MLPWFDHWHNCVSNDAITTDVGLEMCNECYGLNVEVLIETGKGHPAMRARAVLLHAKAVED